MDHHQPRGNLFKIFLSLREARMMGVPQPDFSKVEVMHAMALVGGQVPNLLLVRATLDDEEVSLVVAAVEVPREEGDPGFIQPLALLVDSAMVGRVKVSGVSLKGLVVEEGEEKDWDDLKRAALAGDPLPATAAVALTPPQVVWDGECADAAAGYAGAYAEYGDTEYDSGDDSGDDSGEFDCDGCDDCIGCNEGAAVVTSGINNAARYAATHGGLSLHSLPDGRWCAHAGADGEEEQGCKRGDILTALIHAVEHHFPAPGDALLAPDDPRASYGHPAS